MKNIKTSMLLAGIGLFFCTDFYCQVNNLSPAGQKIRDGAGKAMNAGRKAAEEISARENKDPYIQLVESGRRTKNNHTTKYIYTITVRGREETSILYYAGNEYSEWNTDYNDLKNKSRYCKNAAKSNGPVINPKYRGDKNNDLPQFFDDSNDDFAAQENIFDMSSARENNPIFLPDLESLTSAFDDLDAYLNSNSSFSRGVQINVDPYDIIMYPREDYPSLPATVEISRQKSIDKNLGDFLSRGLRERERKEYLEWYNKNTPWYQKTIDRYNNASEREDVSAKILTLPTYGYIPPPGQEISVAYMAKGAVLAWNKAGDFVVNDVPQLIQKQATKELAAMVSILSEMLPGNKKAEVDLGKAYYDASKSHFIFMGDAGAKLVVDVASGNQNAANIYNDNYNRVNEKLLKGHAEYADAKLFGGVVSTAKKDIQKGINKEFIKPTIKKYGGGYKYELNKLNQARHGNFTGVTIWERQIENDLRRRGK